jgi:hypothetical protein
LVQRGSFKGFVVITTDEWAAATTDASKRALLSGKLTEAWGGQGASSSSSSKEKKGSGSSSSSSSKSKSKSKVEKGV